MVRSCLSRVKVDRSVLPAASASRGNDLLWRLPVRGGCESRGVLWSVQENLDGPVGPDDHDSVRLDPVDPSAGQRVPSPVARHLLRGAILNERDASVVADRHTIERQRRYRQRGPTGHFRGCGVGTIRIEEAARRDHLVVPAGLRASHAVRLPHDRCAGRPRGRWQWGSWSDERATDADTEQERHASHDEVESQQAAGHEPSPQQFRAGGGKIEGQTLTRAVSDAAQSSEDRRDPTADGPTHGMAASDDPWRRLRNAQMFNPSSLPGLRKRAARPRDRAARSLGL